MVPELYNSRWFLFGLNAETKEIKKLPIDRIIVFESTARPFKKNPEVDFESYFDDVVGVTVRNTVEIERVLLKLGQRIGLLFEPKRYMVCIRFLKEEKIRSLSS